MKGSAMALDTPASTNPRASASGPAPARPSYLPDESRVLAMAGLGGRIALARERKGWTQRELSERLGKSRGTIVQYEQGRIEPPLRQVEALAEILEVSPEMLAFGRQAIAGLTASDAKVHSIPEVALDNDKVVASGAYGLPESLVSDFGIDPDLARVFALDHDASAFGLAAGDRVILNAADELEEEGQLYALRTPRGMRIVRLLPSLSAKAEAVKLNDGTGETHSYERDKLEVLGRVVGSIRAS